MKSLNVVNKKAEVELKPTFKDDARPYADAPDTTTEAGRLEAAVVERIKTVFDPEIPVNVFELGLIYGVEVDGAKVHLRMTLTAPNCPVAQILPEQVRQAAKSADGVEDATIEVVWDPPWNPGMMSEAAQLETNLY